MDHAYTKKIAQELLAQLHAQVAAMNKIINARGVGNMPNPQEANTLREINKCIELVREDILLCETGNNFEKAREIKKNRAKVLEAATQKQLYKRPSVPTLFDKRDKK
jgi:hypothetical protein